MPLAVSAEVMTAGPSTVSTRVWLLVPTELLAATPMDTVPAVVGVPLMTPLEALKVAHDGRLLVDSVTPEGVAVSVYVHAVPTVAEDVSAEVMTGAAPTETAMVL